MKKRFQPKNFRFLKLLREGVPIINRYQTILKEDVQSIASDYRLGEISQGDLEKNLENLEMLKNLLGEFIEDPEGFKVVVTIIHLRCGSILTPR